MIPIVQMVKLKRREYKYHLPKVTWLLSGIARIWNWSVCPPPASGFFVVRFDCPAEKRREEVTFSVTGCFPGTIVASAFGQLDASLFALILGPMSPSSESPWHPHSTCTYSKPSEEGLSSFFHLWVCSESLQEQMRYMRITWAAHSTPPFSVWAGIERAWIIEIKGNFL